MTTNITPIEALEKIAKYDMNNRKYINDPNVFRALCEEYVELATQALTPQECDVTKCKFYCSHPNYKGLCLAHCRKEIALKGKHAQDTYCKSIVNCNYKQLHSQEKNEDKFLEKIKEKLSKIEQNLNSQQKTFTYFEVRDILNCILLNYLDNQAVDAYRLDVLSKFKEQDI